MASTTIGTVFAAKAAASATESPGPLQPPWAAGDGTLDKVRRCPGDYRIEVGRAEYLVRLESADG
jgi:hypothetical protein